MKKVNVILSTYNGEKYLSVQLESIMKQTYPNVTIYIRDDGSTDSTLKIISDYQKEYSSNKIKLIEDNLGNLGYVKSFLTCIRHSDEADYYAFCDQDDYWFPNKIERAVQHLEKVETKKCGLYTSAYSVCDGELNVVGKWHKPTAASKLDVGKSLSLYDGGWFLGFTCVLNHELKKRAFDNQVIDMYSHDIWVQAVNIAFGGDLYIDKQVTSYFRRHEGSTSVAETSIARSLFDSWKFRWNEVFGAGNMFLRLKSSMISFKKAYGNCLKTKEDVCFITVFGTEENNLHNRVRKLFYPYRLKKSLLVEMAWRIAILFGKI